MKNSFLIALVIFLSFSLLSCEKKEGEGGTSTIMGRILAKNFNEDFSIQVGEYYAPDVDVFIIYGKDSIYADDFKTNEDGWYRFKFLNKGEYTIYAYSEDPTRTSDSKYIPVSETVTIDENNSTVIVDDLVIYEERNAGSSTIMGRVFVKSYNADFRILLGTYYAPDVDVFINYGEDSIYFDDVKTGLNGWYRFDNLDKGNYTVYTYSEDSTRKDPSNMIPVFETVSITVDNSTKIINDLVIFD